MRRDRRRISGISADPFVSDSSAIHRIPDAPGKFPKRKGKPMLFPFYKGNTQGCSHGHGGAPDPMLFEWLARGRTAFDGVGVRRYQVAS